MSLSLCCKNFILDQLQNEFFDQFSLIKNVVKYFKPEIIINLNRQKCTEGNDN